MPKIVFIVMDLDTRIIESVHSTREGAQIAKDAAETNYRNNLLDSFGGYNGQSNTDFEIQMHSIQK